MKHGRNSFRGSFDVTCACLEPFLANGFLQANTLVYRTSPGAFKIAGELACLGGIVITVYKSLTVLSGHGVEAIIETDSYAYNGSIRGYGNFLRYDNAHPHPGHSDDHHRHEFDWKTGDEVAGSPKWVGVAGWPHLSEFIEEVQAWYWDHRSALPDPDSYPLVGLRSPFFEDED